MRKRPVDVIAKTLEDELGWCWDAVPDQRIPSSEDVLIEMAGAVLAGLGPEGYRVTELRTPRGMDR